MPKNWQPGHLRTRSSASYTVAGQKKPDEGNIINQNSFSVLNDSDIIARVNDMGVKLDENDFASINLLSELEKARTLLFMKSLAQNELGKNIEAPILDDNANVTDALDDI